MFLISNSLPGTNCCHILLKKFANIHKTIKIWDIGANAQEDLTCTK
jgi:hypothetical protein